MSPAAVLAAADVVDWLLDADVDDDAAAAAAATLASCCFLESNKGYSRR